MKSIRLPIALLLLASLSACTDPGFQQDVESARISPVTEAVVPAVEKPTPEPSAAPPERPNVLFIAIDDLRPELGCYGAPQVKSPNLDRLAAGGMLFRRAYCQVAVCGASRASLMTGMLPTATRFRSYLTRAQEDAPNAVTLPQTFKEAGYTTISNGKIFHHADDTQARSWSEEAFRPKGGHAASHDPETMKHLSQRKRGRIYESPDVPDNAYGDGVVAEKTIADLKRLKDAGKPFFLACGFVRPHLPFYAPKKYWDLYQRGQVRIASNRHRPKNAPAELRGSNEFRSYHLAGLDVDSDAFHRVMRHGYMASVSYVDKLVGDVMGELKGLGLEENTIVVVWGDHGWHLGEHNFWGKHNTMHLATRVPIIVKVPWKSAGTSTALVETSDLFPTLCELAGLAVPDTVQGKSFVRVLDDPAQSHRDVVYSRYGPGDAAVSEKFSYTLYRNGTSQMLYDLAKDPDENVNVCSEGSYASTVARMKAGLAERMKEAQSAKVTAGRSGSAPGEKSGKPAAKGGAARRGSKRREPTGPAPQRTNIRYGKHERHVLDLWLAKSEKPTPLVFVIHGGGWSGGEKERVHRFADVQKLLDAGISVAAINYRLMRHSAGVVPPVKAPLHDAARALQFVRSKAREWNIDKTRIGAAGGSAGACSSLWIAYHDDMADPRSADPVARESTRLACAAVVGAQTTLDPKQMKEWTPNSKYGGHAFGKKGFASFLADREKILPWIAEYSPYALVSAGDPPVFISYGAPPAVGKPQKDPTHTANFGVGLQLRCKEFGLECVVAWPGAGTKHKTATEYLIAKLRE
jgi:arylsulfatase A-like enzyme